MTLQNATETLLGRPVLANATLHADGRLRLPRETVPPGDLIITYDDARLVVRAAGPGEIGTGPVRRHPTRGVYLTVRRALRRMDISAADVAGRYGIDREGDAIVIDLRSPLH